MKLIVFKQIDYRDNDLILNCLNENDQKVVFLVRGAKKPTSKSLAYTNLGNVYDYIVDQDLKPGIQKFKGADMIKAHHHIMNSLIKVGCLNCVLEIVDHLCQDDIYHHGLYDRLSLVIGWIDKDDHEVLALALFMAYACELLGITPQIDGCVVCNQSKVVALSIDEGGFVCQYHHCHRDVLYGDIESLKMFRYLNKACFEDYEQLRKININFKCLDCFYNFLQLHGAIKLNSYEFLATILKSAIN